MPCTETCTCISRSERKRHTGAARRRGHHREAPAQRGRRHKGDGDADSPEDIGRTHRYIEDFTAAAEKARSLTDLYQAMVALYPDRVNRGVLWNSAKSFMS
jgi:hypothetical protein